MNGYKLIKTLILLFSIFFITGCEKYYQGPQSDHFDGSRFYNPNEPYEKSALDLARWFLTRNIAPWPEFTPIDSHDKPPKRVDGIKLRVSFVGHATVLIQTHNTNILIDPIWSKRASPVQWAGPKRVHPPGIHFKDLPPIDIVLISHNHYDHMDEATIEQLYHAHNPLFIVPIGNLKTMESFVPDAKVKSLDWQDKLTYSPSIEIIVERTHHWSSRYGIDRNKALWSAFVIKTKHSKPIYYSGDTGMHDGSHFSLVKERYGRPRLAILPIGAYMPRWFMKPYHMNPEEAVQAHKLLNAEYSLGVHYKTFYRLTDEAYGQPLLDLASALEKHAVSNQQFVALDVGKHWWVP